MKQIIGKKIGMVSLFDINGKIIPATIIYCEPNVVLENKGKEAKHGANLLKVGAFEANEKKMNKAEAGIFKKLNLAPNKEIRTIKTDQNLNVGDKITVDSFVSGEFVDVQGTTKGRGFTGAIFRWNKKIGPMSHGHGYPHRWQGSMASGRGGAAPQRVKKGFRMAGHYGNEIQTMQNLNVVFTDVSKNIIAISGSIPGPKRGLVIIKEAIKPHKPLEAYKLITTSVQKEVAKLETDEKGGNE